MGGFGIPFDILEDPARQAGTGVADDVLWDPRRDVGFGPTFQFTYSPIPPRLLKPKELSRDLKTGEGIVVDHFEPGALAATAKGRAVLADNFFDEATVNAKVVDLAIAGAKIKDATVTQAKLDPGVTAPPSGSASGDLAGSYPAPTVAKASGAFALTGTIADTPAVSQNDYNPAGLASASALRLTAAGAIDITGLVGGSSGRILVVHNVGSQTITLRSQSASSTAANRFAFDADVALAGGQSITLRYDGTDSRWRTVSSVGSGGGGGTATALKTTGADVVVSGAAPPTTGQVLKATSATTATWQAEAGGGIAPVSALYFLSANQTIASGGFTDLSGYTKVFDKSSPNFYSAGQPTRFVAPVTGQYLVAISMPVAPGGDSHPNLLAVFVNGTSRYRIAHEYPAALQDGTPTGSIALDLNAGDYFTVQISQASGSNRDVEGGGADTGTKVSIFLIASGGAVASSDYVFVAAGADQNVLSGAEDPITFGNEIADPSDMHAAGTPTRLVATKTAPHQITWNIYATGGTAGQAVFVLVYKNGVQYAVGSVGAMAADVNVSGPRACLSGALDLPLVAGDYVELHLFNDNNATVTIKGTGSGTLSLASLKVLPATSTPTANYFVRVRLSASVNVNNGAANQAISWDVDLTANAAMHSTTVNPSRIVAPVTGRYGIALAYRIAASSAGGTFDFEVWVNGSFVRYIHFAKPDTVFGEFNSPHIYHPLNAGDYLEIKVSNSTGAAVQLAGGANQTELDVILVNSQ